MRGLDRWQRLPVTLGLLAAMVTASCAPTVTSVTESTSPIPPIPTDPPIPGAVTLTPDQFILPDEQFPLPGYGVTTDKAVGRDGWTRTWTTTGGTPFYWVSVDATVLKPSVTSNDAIASTKCDWKFTPPMATSGEVIAPVVGDGAKACAYEAADTASTLVYTTGTRNTLITVSANRRSASLSATTSFLASLADYQLWTIDRVAPAPGSTARAAPLVQIPSAASTFSGGGAATGGGTGAGGGAASGGGTGGTQPNVPAGLPANLTPGTYSLEGCIQDPSGTISYANLKWGHCNPGGQAPLGSLAQLINSASPCVAPGCTASPPSSFDGTQFYILQKFVNCSPGAPCSTGYILLRIRKIA